jgi:GDP-D-mannose dehydratase
MYLMLQQEQSDDYVIATTESYQLAESITYGRLL